MNRSSLAKSSESGARVANANWFSVYKYKKHASWFEDSSKRVSRIPEETSTPCARYHERLIGGSHDVIWTSHNPCWHALCMSISKTPCSDFLNHTKDLICRSTPVMYFPYPWYYTVVESEVLYPPRRNINMAEATDTIEKRHSAVVISIIFTALALIFVCLRIYTRSGIVRNTGSDDCIITLSVVRITAESLSYQALKPRCFTVDHEL